MNDWCILQERQEDNNGDLSYLLMSHASASVLLVLYRDVWLLYCSEGCCHHVAFSWLDRPPLMVSISSLADIRYPTVGSLVSMSQQSSVNTRPEPFPNGYFTSNCRITLTKNSRCQEFLPAIDASVL